MMAVECIGMCVWMDEYASINVNVSMEEKRREENVVRKEEVEII